MRAAETANKARLCWRLEKVNATIMIICVGDFKELSLRRQRGANSGRLNSLLSYWLKFRKLI